MKVYEIETYEYYKQQVGFWIGSKRNYVRVSAIANAMLRYNVKGKDWKRETE